MPDTQVVPIKNSETGAQYELYIKLPKDYSKKKKVTYPVIYFTDAAWSIEILSAATSYQLKDVILIGISWQKNISDELKKVGEYVSRNRDYTIRESNRPDIQAKYQLGQAKQHTTFIRKDVITYVEKNYRTQPDNRTYFGYSLGGQFGAFVLLYKPDTFKNYIIGSPEISGEVSEFSSLAAKTRKKLNANLFVSYGSLETDLAKHANELIRMLNSRNDDSLSISQMVIDGNHSTAFPLTGVKSITWLSNLIKQKD